MGNVLVVSLRAAAVTIVLTGIAYPLAVTGVAQVLFPRAAGGSLVTDADGAVVGSGLIGQSFSHPAYLQGRPSSAGQGYDAAASSGSNLGPTSKSLRDRVTAAVEKLRAQNPGAPGPVPAELVTTSGSGLDPHLSPESAHWQVPRIAAARKVSEERVRAVVTELVEGRELGFLGEPRVNVLAVNRALDARFGHPAPPASIPPR